MNRFGLLFGIMALASASAVAEPPAGTDEALFRELIGEETIPSKALPTAPDANVRTGGPSTSQWDPASVARLLTGLRSAEQGLNLGAADRSTRDAQAEVIAELEKIIDAAKRSRPKSQEQQSSDGESSGQPNSQPGASPSPQATPRAGSAAGQGAGVPSGTPTANREGKADESSERLRDPNGVPRGIPEFRARLVSGPWGHLPPRMRERLLNAGSDRYVPEYDPLVREYFESLARPAESPKPDR